MLFTALITLIAIGFVATMAASWLNRGRLVEHKRAKKLAREHLIPISNGQSFEVALRSIGLLPSEFGRGKCVLQVLAHTFGLFDVAPPRELALADVLRIHLSNPVDGINLVDIGPNKCIEPFTYDLIENLLANVDKRLWNERLAIDRDFPATEEALINLILSMTVESFVRYFFSINKANS